MSLKIKAIIVGVLSVICGLIASYIALFNMIYHEGVIFLVFTFLYIVLRDKYADIRCREIDEEFQRGCDSK